MWKYLETHKHRYGLVLFAIGLVWLIAGFLPGTGRADHLRHLVGFIAVASVAAFYYASGVPGLLQGLTFIGLAFVCLGLAALPALLPLRQLALAPDFAYATAAIVFILLAFLWQLPRRVRDWASRRAQPARPPDQTAQSPARTTQPDLSAAPTAPTEPDLPAAAAVPTAPDLPDLPAASAAPTTPDLPDTPDTPAMPKQEGLEPEAPVCRAGATPYRQVRQYKQALLDSFRSWSLANALPAMRWFRVVLALLLALAGVACIVLALTRHEPGVRFFQSQRFSLLFAGVAAFFYAAGVITLGLLRGLALPGMALLTFYSVLGVVRIEGVLSHRPLALRAAVILVFLALYSLLVYLLVRGFRRRHDLFNWVYQSGPRIIGVDIALKDLLPIADYSERIDAIVLQDEAADEDRLRQRAVDIATGFQYRLNMRKILPVGFRFEPDTRRLTLHAYCRGDQVSEGIGYCERILSLQGLAAEVRHEPDPEWRVYRETLFPDAVTLHEIVNVQQLDLLDGEGVDLQRVHPVRVELRFPDCGKREAAQARLAAAGFRAVTDDSLDSRERAVSENEPEYCLAFIELETRLGLERINTLTGTIICLIEPFEGDLFGWELIAPADAAPPARG